jgi:hypothetical protein
MNVESKSWRHWKIIRQLGDLKKLHQKKATYAKLKGIAADEED